MNMMSMQLIQAQQIHGMPLNTLELNSVSTLIRYVAEEQKTSAATVRSIVETEFGVEDVQMLPQKNYDAVIRFLIDLQVNALIN